MTDFWKGKKVIVTGGAGFLGSHLVPRLTDAGASVFVPRSAQYDLRTEDGVTRMFEDAGPSNVLFHLAATVGGIGANQQRPADFIYDNLVMNALMVEQSRKAEVGKFVGLGSVCAYPRTMMVYPMREENIFEGYPEPTNAPYGIAKRALLVHLQAARRQYGFNGICLFPTNLYGPGDSFDPETSHVVPAIISKMVEARRQNKFELTLWGTGRPTRDFLYVEDAAGGLMLAAEKYNRPEPINLGSGRETTIAGLAEAIERIVEYEGQIVWDKSKPDGQPRRVLNSERAAYEFGWRAMTNLGEGLEKTVRWYEEISEEEISLA